MANNTIQIKRTSVSGRAANTSTLPNAGELAINMTDGIMYSTNGSVVFEVGANLTSLNVTGGLKANGSFGSADQVLTTNSTGIYWSTPSAGGDANVSIKTYTYTISSNTTVITGADDNSNTLSYTAGIESVYLNGSKQISGTDYETTDSGTITFTSNTLAADVVQIVATEPALNVIEGTANSATTDTTANNVVDSFDIATYRSAKYIVQITSGTDYHVTEVLLIHDGTTVHLTEYGTVYTNTSLGIVDASINSANLELLVAPTNASSTVKTRRISLDV